MKTKSKKTIIRRMWAIRWLSHGKINHPHPVEHGAWMLCPFKSMALNKRLKPEQIITPVRVIILKDNTPNMKKLIAGTGLLGSTAPKYIQKT